MLDKILGFAVIGIPLFSAGTVLSLIRQASELLLSGPDKKSDCSDMDWKYVTSGFGATTAEEYERVVVEDH
ncbi:hypothetical protein [Haloarcula brevis]|uniref:hypothetical protein n=1 Tax=Haloarcula brevis TaxID=3111453 RepID=UPI00300F13CD